MRRTIGLTLSLSLLAFIAIAAMTGHLDFIWKGQAEKQAVNRRVNFTISPAKVRPNELVQFEWHVPKGVSRIDFTDQWGRTSSYDRAKRRDYAFANTFGWDETTEVRDTDEGYHWRQQLRMIAPAKGTITYTITAYPDDGGTPLTATAQLSSDG